MDKHGVVEGANGFIAAVNLIGNNKLVISGFDVSGVGPGSSLEIVKMNFQTVSAGTSQLALKIKNLADSKAAKILANAENGSYKRLGVPPRAVFTSTWSNSHLRNCTSSIKDLNSRSFKTLHPENHIVFKRHSILIAILNLVYS